MLLLTFKVNANPPVPQGPEVTRVRMGVFPDDEVDFDDTTPVVVTGSGLTLGEGDAVKIELCPGKGEAVSVEHEGADAGEQVGELGDGMN